MTTRRLVDPEIVALIDRFPRWQFSPETLPRIRADWATLSARRASGLPDFPDIVVTERVVPGPEGAPGVRVLVYLPQSAPRPLPALLSMHAGGYMLGSADDDDLWVKRIVTDIGLAAVSVDYRLAPETPFPGAVEDCYAALTWLHAHAPELGIDQGRIAIGGVSAGGGLAAGVGLLARDWGDVPLAFQLLIQPMLDDRTIASANPHPCTGEFMWTPGANRFAWSALLGQEPGSAGVSPYAAAARAECLAGLPPTFISVGALDLFLEENLEYARRLMREGVPTELHIYPGAVHGFQLMAGSHAAQAHTRDSMDALRRALHPHHGAPPVTAGPA